MNQYLKTGPEHLAEFARLAHAAGCEAEPAQALATATLAHAHATAAQTLVFAAMVASDGEEFGGPWLELIDPDGSKREAAAEREERRRAELEAEHEKRIADLRSEPPSYNFGPLVPEQG